MVVLNKYKKFNGRRVGQAQMNGMNAQQLNFYGDQMENNSPFTGNTVDFIGDVTNPSDEVVRNLSAFQADQLDEHLPLDTLEADTGLDIDLAIDPNNGSRVLVATDNVSGAQVVTTMPQQQVAPAQDVCEFPAQSVNLQRQVLITNTTPQIIDVQTDVCGNVISYTEQMTRNMNATAWNATNPAQLNGPVRQFSTNANGTIINGSGYVRLANSTGPLNGNSGVNVSTVQGPLVGGRKFHKSNTNAAYGASILGKYRGQ